MMMIYGCFLCEKTKCDVHIIHIFINIIVHIQDYLHKIAMHCPQAHDNQYECVSRITKGKRYVNMLMYICVQMDHLIILYSQSTELRGTLGHEIYD